MSEKQERSRWRAPALVIGRGMEDRSQRERDLARLQAIRTPRRGPRKRSEAKPAPTPPK